jgi:coenzyme F420-reducing hydrogenase delta subunit
MVRRSDDLPFPAEAQVNPSLCVSCGICVASCPSSTPFRRSEELKTGIDLPEYSLRVLRERTVEAAASLTGSTRILVLACEHGGGAGHLTGVVPLPCVAMAPPSLIDYVLSKKLADGVVVAGCAESACFHRLGVAWTKERFAGERDPYLRARVPRERLKAIWASALETQRFERELADFTEHVGRLSQAPRAPELPQTLISARWPEPERAREGSVP